MALHTYTLHIVFNAGAELPKSTTLLPTSVDTKSATLTRDDGITYDLLVTLPPQGDDPVHIDDPAHPPEWTIPTGKEF